MGSAAPIVPVTFPAARKSAVSGRPLPFGYAACPDAAEDAWFWLLTFGGGLPQPSDVSVHVFQQRVKRLFPQSPKLSDRPLPAVFPQPHAALVPLAESEWSRWHLS